MLHRGLCDVPVDTLVVVRYLVLDTRQMEVITGSRLVVMEAVEENYIPRGELEA